MTNILFQSDFGTPFNTLPFSQFSENDYPDAIKHALTEAYAEVEAIKTNADTPTFENTILVLENAGKILGRNSSVFFNMNSCHTSPTIQQQAQEISPLLSKFSNDILLDEKLFERVKAVYDQKDNLELSAETLKLLTDRYKAFERNGALLDGDKKQALREVDEELGKLTLQFSENVLADTNSYELVLENEGDLNGLPQAVKDAFALEAEQKGHEGKWMVTLQYPSYIPFVTYAENRELRQKLQLEFMKRGNHDNENNNSKNIQRIVELRKNRAQLLGYNSHADFTLENRMAEKPETVISFLEDLLTKAKPVAQKEIKELAAYAQKLDNIDQLMPWDMAFYGEKLKKEKFAIDDELLRPYFQLEKVLVGAFQVAGRLFGLQFVENRDIEVYHEDVTAYEVINNKGETQAVFYADFFPRESKRSGAWMTSYRDQSRKNGVNEVPHISIVCNFTKPGKDSPSLLTLNEVLTLFHEFGHALHGILSDVEYTSQAGTNVYWDFVELPSQILENWVYEEETLQLFARHYETGELIPQEYIENIRKSASFMEGRQTLRQLSFGLVRFFIPLPIFCFYGQHRSL